MQCSFMFWLKLDQWNYDTVHVAKGYTVEPEEQ